MDRDKVALYEFRDNLGIRKSGVATRLQNGEKSCRIRLRVTLLASI